MELSKNYDGVLFRRNTLIKATRKFEEISFEGEEKTIRIGPAKIIRGNENWSYDNLDDFFHQYEHFPNNSTLQIIIFKKIGSESTRFSIHCSDYTGCTIYVEFADQEKIETIFEIFDDAIKENYINNLKNSELETDFRIKIFIGHGHSSDWRDLKDHLQDKHEISVESFESGARSGHHIRDILFNLTRSKNFAILILTGEDKMEDGTIRARQNVIHETGLFQGSLGFDRVAVLLEQDVEEFSNINGVQQLRFKKGNIAATFGDILAILRREFGTI